MSFQLQGLLSSIQHARGANGIVPGNPSSPPGLEAAPHGGHNAAQFYRHDAQGHEGYAAQLWMSRHPHAVRNGMIPDWVSQAMTGQISSALHQPLPAPSAPQTVGQPNMGFHHAPAPAPTNPGVNPGVGPVNPGVPPAPQPGPQPGGGPLQNPYIGGQNPPVSGQEPYPLHQYPNPGPSPQPQNPQLAAQRALIGYA